MEWPWGLCISLGASAGSGLAGEGSCINPGHIWPHQPEGPSPERWRMCGVSHRLPVVRLTEACWVLGGITAGGSARGSVCVVGGGGWSSHQAEEPHHISETRVGGFSPARRTESPPPTPGTSQHSDHPHRPGEPGPPLLPTESRTRLSTPKASGNPARRPGVQPVHPEAQSRSPALRK